MSCMLSLHSLMTSLAEHPAWQHRHNQLYVDSPDWRKAYITTACEGHLQSFLQIGILITCWPRSILCDFFCAPAQVKDGL